MSKRINNPVTHFTQFNPTKHNPQVRYHVALASGDMATALSVDGRFWFRRVWADGSTLVRETNTEKCATDLVSSFIADHTTK